MLRWIVQLGCLVFCTQAAAAQSVGRITGVVTNETGQPIVGATLTVEGAPPIALTGTDGKYVIAGAPAGPQRVRATLIGYRTTVLDVLVAAGESVTLDFQLATQAISLEEVVITGYGSQQRRELVGAIARIRSEQFAVTPTSNVMQAIQGRLAGVDIVSTGYRPGASLSVRIRGVRSMVATNDPLLVVDGIPIAGGIEDLAPASIASIDVLKDAAATAIYGTRGANGVVLITTQNGAGLGTRFTYDTYVGWQKPVHLVDMMNGPEYAAYKKEAWRAAGRDTADASVFTAQELASIRAGTWTDWQQMILRSGLQKSHQLGISGVSGTTRFSFFGNFFDESGITLGQNYERASGTLTLDHAVGRLRLGATATASRSVTKIGRGDGLWSEALRNSPLGMPYDSNGVLQFRPTEDPLRVNPLSEVASWKRDVTRNRIFGSLFAELQLTDALSWRANFGPDMSDRLDGEFRGPLTSARSGALAEAFRLDEETFAYTFDNLLRLRRDLGARHNIDGTLLYSIQQERYEFTRAAAQNLPYEQQLWYNLGTGEVRADVQSGLKEWTLQSFMARLHYAFAKRYLVTLSGRFDGSSRLAPENRWAFFPSIGLGWHISEEGLLRDVDLLSNLKLRASYGRAGNTSIDPYQTQGSLERTRYNFGNVSGFGYRPGQIPNPDLEWEKTDQLDVGVDFSAWNERLSGTIDYYRQQTTDLLMLRQLPASSGFTQALQNIGETRNTGIEIGLSTVLISGWQGLRWTTDINWSHNKNEIVSLYGSQQDDPGNSWFIGQPINLSSDRLRRVFYDYKFAGIWQESEAEEAARFGQRPGDIKVEDINGDGVINAADRVIIGNTYPTWTGSLASRITWKNFDLSILATARLGYTISDNFGTLHNGLYGRFGNLDVDYYTPTRPSNEHPRPNAGREAPLYDNARGYLSGSHARIRTISLGYTLPHTLTERWGGDAMRFYLTAQEPFVFSSYRGYDPEAGTVATPPSHRTLVVGAGVVF